MITGELKNKIDGLWDIFAAGGLVNPLEVIEQITYLMFIHDLDDSDNTRAKESAMLGLPYKSIFSDEVKIGERTIDGSQLKWSVFHDFPADRMYSVMQGGYSRLSRHYMQIRIVHILSTWMMQFLNFLHHFYYPRWWIHWMKSIR